MSGLGTGVLVFLGAALLALGLEVPGTGPGERKRIPRLHQAVVVALAGAVGFVVAPGAAHAVLALLLSLFALAEGAALPGERAALALLLAAGTSAVTAAPATTASLLAWLALWTASFAGLSARAGQDAATEAATKAAVTGAMAAVLVGAGLVVGGGVGRACEVCGFGLAVGLPPLQGPRVDVTQGAPVPAVALLAPAGLLVLGPAVAERLSGDGSWRALRDGTLVLGLVGLPLVALAQTSIRRVLAVLLIGQAVLPVVAAAAGGGLRPATWTATLGAAGLAIAASALPVLVSPAVTWEDASGWGRRHPWRAGLLVMAAAQACGLPPAVGFVVRVRLAEALAPQDPVLAAAVLFGTGLAAVPVVRLALFLYAKEPRPSPPPPPARGAVVGLALVVTLGMLAALVLEAPADSHLFPPAG